ncbi:hypothetical protein GCM10017667_44770 [Streptomyces filamentosus]|uniref:Uncharacterized protein n=2 Tax=Streptomyces filamentosus TaxID=67294 RepID=A0A919ENZ9_STRFL|nr:hypothetical protein GCM10017667_44770 [Streptomyces filamentosus]
MAPVTWANGCPGGNRTGPTAFSPSFPVRLRTDRVARCTGPMLTINVAVLLAVIVVMRLRRRTQARSRAEERNTALLVLVLGILIAPTPVGQSVFDGIGRLVRGVSGIGL